MTDKNNKFESGHPLLILSIAIIILIFVSFVPLSKESGGVLKDFNLFADLSNKPADIEVNTETYIDPDLIEMTDNNVDNISHQGQTTSDVTGVADSQIEHDNNDNGLMSSDSVDTLKPITNSSSNITDNQDNELVANRGMIEDYTPGNIGFSNFKNALNSGRLARIAVIGDSYIEGDIFTQDIREKLQDIYGGGGVGYIPASSNLTGFRQSVNQSCSGWKEFDFRRAGKKYPTLQGFYYSPSSGQAKTTIKGANRMPHGSSWDKSRILFIAPEDMTIKVATDGDEQEYNIVGSEDVQQILIEGVTSKYKISASNNSLILLGIYTDGSSGIALDNMSIRGYSGIKHSSISKSLADQMRQFVDYDLIIVEYGTNALSAQQTDYSAYIKLMEQSISHIKECYPNADILIMGIGDRGEKAGTEIRSMPVVAKLIGQQRSMAKNLGVLFWDTRAAMGGENSVVDWAKTGHINKDYIHLSGKGGERLSRLFVESLKSSLND